MSPTLDGLPEIGTSLQWVSTRGSLSGADLPLVRSRSPSNTTGTELWSSVERLHVLDLHRGFVKGVCWDPVGEFLATASDDRSVKIWRTSDWSLEAEVEKPFEASPGTFFRRLRSVTLTFGIKVLTACSWSPDGAHITASNATNNQGFVFIAAVIARNSWTSEISLVGHENTVEVSVCRFFLAPWPLTDFPSAITLTYLCATLHSQSSHQISVLLWPLVVTIDLFLFGKPNPPALLLLRKKFLSDKYWIYPGKHSTDTGGYAYLTSMQVPGWLRPIRGLLRRHNGCVPFRRRRDGRDLPVICTERLSEEVRLRTATAAGGVFPPWRTSGCLGDKGRDSLPRKFRWSTRKWSKHPHRETEYEEAGSFA